MDPTFAVKLFGALFAIMNPITNLPIFLSVTNGANPGTQRHIALKTALYTLILGGIFGLAGTQILKIFGIDIEDFRVAGGLVILLMALNMLRGTEIQSHTGSAEEKATFPDPSAVAFYPMAFPMIVGPGTITTLVLFKDKAATFAEQVTYWCVFAGLVAIIAATFYNAPTFARHLSSTARVIMSRLMGMILAAIAAEMILEGLRKGLPGLA